MDRRSFLALLGAGVLPGCSSDGRETATEETSSTTATPVTTRVRSETETGTPTPAPTDTPETVESLPPPTMGDADADVTITVFEDFACPHCRRFSLEVLPRLVSEYIDPEPVRYEHRDFPIPVNGWSWPVANAARAVQHLAGDVSFFEYSRALFENQSRYSFDLLVALADELGVDGGTVREAAEGGRYRPVLEADRQLGNEMGLRGTPEVYVNGTRVENYAYGTIRPAVESEL